MILRKSDAQQRSKERNDEDLSRCVAKYKRLRALSRSVLEEEIQREASLNVSVCPVNEDCFKAISKQWCLGSRAVPFRWEQELMPVIWSSHPRALDLSFWCEKKLCGLAVARLSDSREWLSITHIEGSPDPSHALKRKVVQFALVGADIFASLVQHESGQAKKPVVRLLNPLPQSIGWYAHHGYINHVQKNGYSFLTR